jgi:hypothetical protein
MKEILNEYKRRGILKPANSPWNAPLFLAPKPGATPDMPSIKKHRLVADYRQLNKVIRPDYYPMPHIQDLLDSLGHHNEFFCKVDLRQAFHHIPLATEDCLKTAVSTPEGQKQFLVYMYGIKNGPPVFQRAGETILREHLYKRCLIYIDDIIIFGKTFAEMCYNLNVVLQCLAKAGASIDLGKSRFLATEIEFLGHIIDRTGSRRLERNLSAVTNFPQPTTKNQLLRFIGLASYLRSNMPTAFAEHERRLRRVVPKPGFSQIIWTDDAHEAFQLIKDSMTQVTRLERFHPDRITEVHCDASAQSLGAILIQKDDSGTPHVIEYASRVLSQAEQNYSNTERELLAAVWAVTHKFRHYLEVRPFTVLTDHKALLGTMKLTTQPSTRTIRFLMLLEPFNYEFRYCPGRDLAGPDALSRVSIMAAITSSSLPTPPDTDRPLIIQRYHEEFGHQGWKKVYRGLQDRFSWPKMRQQIWQQLKSCQVCFTFNSATVKIGTHLESIKVTKPREILCIDFYGPLPLTPAGNRYAMIGIDHFSKFAFGIPIQKKNTEAATQFLQDIFDKHGSFNTVLGDRDPVFRGKEFGRFLNVSGCNLHVAQATHAEANGCCERFIKTLGTIQAKVTALNNNPSTSWDQTLTDSIKCYNGTPHSTTDAVPGTVFFSKPWILDADTQFGVIPPTLDNNEIILNSRQAQESSTTMANRHHWPHFSVGDRVAIVRRLPNEKKHNADRRFRNRKEGPYKVVTYEGKGRYVLTSDGHNRITGNAWELIPCKTGVLPQREGGGE